ncbi:MAG: glycosyltransferase [Proteobacteria bacterium]|nr:glycosyltransferase [Pseudomonadota bacterium]MBI3495802.1 glycosyltransferase [Pseudomonadota bacterium]
MNESSPSNRPQSQPPLAAGEHPAAERLAQRHQIAVLIPCRDEARTIGAVIADFRKSLPGSDIYVYDNGSSDGTAEHAQTAGALVRHEPLRGKGNVVRRMFADVEAEVYVLVDGDDTYDAASAPALIQALLSGPLDMVNAARVPVGVGAYRPGHRLGNRALTQIVAWVFGDRFSDMLSGYRVMSRRFVKSFPALSSGFEIETELTVHALELGISISEMPAPYRARPEGSASKLRTVSDGIRILRLIVTLVKEERPFSFFATIAAGLASVSIILAWPVLLTYLATGLVPRLPTAVLSTGLMLLASLSLACGLILDSTARARKEMKRLSYLALPAPHP